MKHWIKPAFALAFIASGAQAQKTLTGEEFDALSLNSTLYFTENGVFYGAEQYLPDRRTIWRAEDGTCVNGEWAEVEGDICFMYDNGSVAACWQIVATEQGLTITSANNFGQPPTVLELSGQDTTPILCVGPKFGV